LIRDVVIRISLPSPASLEYIIVNDLIHDIVRPLQHIQEQTTTNMPCQMAMERPDTRVVLIELQYHERRNDASGSILRILKHVHIATDSVFRVRNSAIPVPEAFGEDVKVMAVEMHGVTADETIVDEVDADGLVGAEVVDVPDGAN
jgi:hypothetical protein